MKMKCSEKNYIKWSILMITSLLVNSIDFKVAIENGEADWLNQKVQSLKAKSKRAKIKKKRNTKRRYQLKKK
ncbi:hypothetical protein [Prevotella bivia]|uniref:hypothetical protein n=1 Tax=Prevotella bivia TaxID=28125 RepID=UPI002550A8DD|nr:hypothetical protein [Prevotella bivia]